MMFCILLVTSPLGHLYFHYGHLSIKFCCCDFLVDVFMKGLFLMPTTSMLPILKAEIAVLLVLDIRLPDSSQILMQNTFV